MKKLLSLAIATVMALSCTAAAFAMPAEPSVSPTGGNGFPFEHVIVETIESLGEYYKTDEELRALAEARAVPQEEKILTEITDSATGKDDGYVFENVVVLTADDIMALSGVTDYALNPRTVVIFEDLISARTRLRVDYRPSNLPLYYGIATTTSTATARYYSNEATGGTGTVLFVPPTSGTYYPYIGNSSDKLMYVDFSYYSI